MKNKKHVTRLAVRLNLLKLKIRNEIKFVQEFKILEKIQKLLKIFNQKQKNLFIKKIIANFKSYVTINKICIFFTK